MIDLHAHILHKIDDGPQSVEESLEMCRIAIADGIKKIVATPHIYPGVYDNDKATIIDKVNQLREKINEADLDIEIFPGADTYFSPQLFLSSNSGYLCVNDNKRHLMIQLPQILPLNIEALFFNLRSKGLVPIISHPERNFDIQKNPNKLKRLVEMGALAQLTAMSLTGGFGDTVKNCARTLLMQNLIHIISSDAHSVNKRPPILSEAVKIASEIVGKEVAYSMVHDNPLQIIMNRENKKSGKT